MLDLEKVIIYDALNLLCLAAHHQVTDTKVWSPNPIGRWAHELDPMSSTKISIARQNAPSIHGNLPLKQAHNPTTWGHRHTQLGEQISTTRAEKASPSRLGPPAAKDLTRPDHTRPKDKIDHADLAQHWRRWVTTRPLRSTQHKSSIRLWSTKLLFIATMAKQEISAFGLCTSRKWTKLHSQTLATEPTKNCPHLPHTNLN